jgi:hypothetical protein
MTINVPIEEFKEKYESYKSYNTYSIEDELYFHVETRELFKIKYEDENYFVLEVLEQKIGVEKTW